MQESDQVLAVIRQVVEKQLAPAHILKVYVKEDVDYDGDQILRVEVVFEVEGDRLDPKKVVGLVRHLREPLEELHENRFPLFSFMKPGEVDGAAA